MQTGVLSWKRALAMGLCVLIAGCGELQGSADGERVAERDFKLDSDLDPSSPEYEAAKLALVDTAGSAVEVPPPSEPSQLLANAIVQDAGCRARSLDRNDDGSTTRIALPFAINFYGVTQTGLYINNNGNITFNSPQSTFTPFTIDARTPPIIAPFFADVDTRSGGSGIVQYSNAPISFGGRQAFCVNWVGVGYYSAHSDKLNSFQLLLVDRNDTGVDNFDIVMNYNQVLWETGDASGGSGGFGGTPAGAGFSAGTGNPAAFFQFPGSLSHSGLLDSNGATGLTRTSHFSTVPGRHVFSVRSGQPIVDELIQLSPVSATGEVGSSHTVTATLLNDRNAPLPNRAVTFQIVSGPNSNLPGRVVTSNASGQASFTYTGTGGVGQDRIHGSFVKSTGSTVTSDPVTMNWTITAHPPVALCQNITLVADNVCGASGSINNGSFDPDGDLASCTQSPGPIYTLGSTPVTLTCTDRRGLTSSCTGAVTVRDTSGPAITCPAAQTAECVAGHATVNVPNATGTDNCGSPTITGPAGSASYPLGSTPLTFTAADGSGNRVSCATSVNVVDTIAPTLSCSSPLVAECTGNHAASVNVPNATGSDACSSVAITGAAGPRSYSIGTTAVSFTGTDTSGNTAACATEVTVVDTTAPTISCPAPIVAECTASGSATVNVASATASDVCGGTSVTGPAGAASYPLGTTPLNFNTTDDFGNRASCASSVTVRDTSAPVFDPITLAPQTVAGNCDGSPVTFTPPTAFDCQAVTVTCTPVAGNSLGANISTCTATDVDGRQTTATITVNVLEALHVRVQAPLWDDNDPDDIETDGDSTNLFAVGSTITNQVKVYSCDCADVTASIANTAIVQLAVKYRDDADPSASISITPTHAGIGGPNGELVSTGDSFEYDQATDSTYPSGSWYDGHYFQNVISVRWRSAPSVVVGAEDVRLETP